MDDWIGDDMDGDGNQEKDEKDEKNEKNISVTVEWEL